jgi:hypothetical protein
LLSWTAPSGSGALLYRNDLSGLNVIEVAAKRRAAGTQEAIIEDVLGGRP